MIGGTSAPDWCGAIRSEPRARCYQLKGHKGPHRRQDGRTFRADDASQSGAPSPVSPDARYLIGEAEHFRRMGINPLHVAAEFGISIRSLERQFHRLGRPDLAAWSRRHDERVPA